MADIPSVDADNEFTSPPSRYRGVTLWMLNDRLEKDEIRRQLDAFAAGGWGAVIARTFPGLLTEYLSEEYIDITKALVTRAGEHGMRTWLQAGYMPGAVPGLAEEVQYHGLRAVPKKGGDTGIDSRLAVSSYGGTGEGFETVAEDDEYVYECGRMPEVLDLLNGPAVTEYLDNAYKKPWYDHLGEHFGKTIEAVWVDEPHFRPQLLPWSRTFPETFENRFGYDINAHIPSLFGAVGDWRKIRHHYWRCIVQMFMDAYFAHVGEWCGKHGVKFAGHLMGEDSLASQTAWTGAAMRAYEHMQLPGIDHLTMDLTWPLNKKFILTPKQATSVANQLGKDEVLAEIYAVSSHRITFRDRKRIFNWMAVLGISYRCNHAAFYSMRGARKRMYVPQLGVQQPWWPENRLMADYAARVSWFMQQGYRQCGVLVIHPQESAYCLHRARQGGGADAETQKQLKAINDNLIDLCDTLLGMQRDFEFGDEALISKYGSVKGKKLQIGRIGYATVVLPDVLTLRKTTLDLLNAFIAAGGTVLSTGTLPERIDGIRAGECDGETAGGLKMLLESVVKTGADRASLAAAIDAVVPAPFRLAASDGVDAVWGQLRIMDGTTGLMLVNTSQTDTVTTELTLPNSGLPELWDLETGGKVPAVCMVADDEVRIPLTLTPDEAVLYVLDENSVALPVAAPGMAVSVSIPLSDEPAVLRRDPNSLPLDMARYRKGDDEWSACMGVTMLQKELTDSQYHGPVTVEYAFDITDVPEAACLVVETPERYGIKVNGKPVDVGTVAGVHPVDPSLKLLPVAALLKPGTNTVQLAGEYHAIGTGQSGLQSQHEVHDGTEIEAVYLTGDFAVTGELAADPPPGCIQYKTRSIIAEQERGGWNPAATGYPFFSGKIALSDTIVLKALAEGERAVLTLPALHAPVARITVNGQEAGLLAWPPLELDITALCVDGENEIEIELVTSLRNLLGPFHRAAGETFSCWRNAWDDLSGQTVFEHADEATEWTDDYMVIALGTGAAPVIEIRTSA